MKRFIYYTLSGWLLITSAHSSLVYNRVQVQRGAHVFMLHCSGCHSLRYMRYIRLSDDLGFKNRSYKPILSSLSAAQARSWFGREPPDLSLIAQETGQKWLRLYLQGFYPDQHKPFGVNNYIQPDVAMPDVFSGLNLRDQQQAIEDVLAFLDYTAKPERGVSYSIGIVTVIFILLFMFLRIS